MNLEKEKKFESVLARLEEWLGKRKYNIGERLPSERSLAEQFGVSRNAVREALLVLQKKGVVETRRGTNGGAFVKPPAPKILNEDLDLMLRLHWITLDQVAEFREAIEWSVTSLAARKANGSDVRALKQLVAEAETYAGRGSGWSEQFIQADKDFHLCVAKISDNPLGVQALEATLNAGRYFTRFSSLGEKLVEENLKDLRQMVAAIENRHSDLAGNLAMDHIARFNSAVSN